MCSTHHVELFNFDPGGEGADIVPALYVWTVTTFKRAKGTVERPPPLHGPSRVQLCYWAVTFMPQLRTNGACSTIHRYKEVAFQIHFVPSPLSMVEERGRKRAGNHSQK